MVAPAESLYEGVRWQVPQQKAPPERGFAKCARVDSNHHGLLVHKALNLSWGA
jgi:hypothetical protein